MNTSYRDLNVWKKAISLVKDVYVLTRHFPRSEMYGLTNQIRRAAVSIPSNIAEGQGRLSRNEWRQFLGIARGSLLELETQTLLACELGFSSESDTVAIRDSIAEVGRMLNGLIDWLNRTTDQ